MTEKTYKGFDHFAGLNLILGDGVYTLENLVKFTRAPESLVVEGLKQLESRKYLKITRKNGKIESFDVTGKGYVFYNDYV